MKTGNKISFDNFDTTHYKSAQEARKEYFIFENKFLGTLGYDEDSDGYIVLQSGHQPYALPTELPLAEFLKNEQGEGKQIDATIDDMPFEFKTLISTTNFYGRIRKDLMLTLEKGCKNVVINICQDIKKTELLHILRRLAHNPHTDKVDKVWYLFNGKLHKTRLEAFKDVQ